MEYINQLDHKLMLFLNGLNSPFWDPIMVAISGKLIWAPLYIFIVFLSFRFFKKYAIVIVISILLSVGISDLIASKLFKPGIERLRPCHEPVFADLLNTPDGCGGKYGYFSSHASTTFAIAFFAFLLFKNKIKGRWLFLVWSLTVSYSRIYLGVHFPADVISGAICGIIVALIIFRVCKYTLHKQGITTL